MNSVTLLTLIYFIILVILLIYTVYKNITAAFSSDPEKKKNADAIFKLFQIYLALYTVLIIYRGIYGTLSDFSKSIITKLNL